MDDRTRALQEIAGLAREHGISTADIAAAVGEAPPAVRAGGRRPILVRAFGALGATFVFAGVGVFIATQWAGMSSAARVVVTLGSGLAAFTLAALAHRDVRFETAATPLLFVSAALEPTGMLVAFDEFGSGGDWRLAGLVAAGTMGLQFAATFVAFRRGAPLALTVLFSALFWWAAFDLLDVDGGVTALVLGASGLLMAAAMDRAGHRDITPLVYFAGAAACLGGLFDLVERTRVEIIFLAVAAGFVYVSVLVRSRTLLVVATLAVLAYTGWFTAQHFADSIGWPLALIVLGLFMIGVSALAYRIDRKYVRQ